MPSRASPGSYPGPVQVHPGSEVVPSRFAMCFVLQCFGPIQVPRWGPSRPVLAPSCSRAFLTGSGVDGQKQTSWPLPKLPSPKLSPKIPPKLSLLHKRGFFLVQNSRGEVNCETIERQKISRGNFCPTTSRCLFWPTGQFLQISLIFRSSADFSTIFVGVCKRSGEGVVWRNGRPKNGGPKGCFWGVHFFSAPLRFSGASRANVKGTTKKRTLSKNTLLDDRFAARCLLRSSGAL